MRLTVGSTETALPDVPCYHDHHQPRTRPIPSETLSAAPQPPSALWTGRKTPAEAGGWGAKCLVHRIAGCSAELLCSLIIFFPFLIRVPKGKALVAFRLNSPCHRHKLSKEGEFSFCSWLSLKHISFFLFLTLFLEDSAL